MGWAYCNACTTLHGHHGDARAIVCAHPAEAQESCRGCLGYPVAAHATWCREGPMQDENARLKERVAALEGVAEAARGLGESRKQTGLEWLIVLSDLRAALARLGGGS